MYLSEMLQRDLAVKAVFDVGGKHVPLDSFHWICDYNFFFFAFSTACPILLLTFETSVRLIWLKKTSPFKSVMGANQNPATLLCVIALCLWGRAMILKLCRLLNVTSAVAAGNFKLRNHCQTNMHY